VYSWKRRRVSVASVDHDDSLGCFHTVSSSELALCGGVRSSTGNKEGDVQASSCANPPAECKFGLQCDAEKENAAGEDTQTPAYGIVELGDPGCNVA